MKIKKEGFGIMNGIMSHKRKNALVLGSLIVLTLFLMQALAMGSSVASTASLSANSEKPVLNSTSSKDGTVITSQGVNVVIDGQISPGEYQVKDVLVYDPGKGKVFWMHYTIDRANGMLYMALHARALGWVGIAFNWTAGPKMMYTDIIIGYHDSNTGQTVIEDNYGATTGTHKPDTQMQPPGTNDILSSASSENASDTILEFSRKLNTGDQWDFPISGGTTTGLMWGYHTTTDDLVTKHDKKGTIAAYTFKSVPAAPQNLQATKVSSSQVDLTWTAPADDGGDAITQYRVYRSTTSGSGYVQIGTTTQTSFSDTTVSVGNTYYYIVAAENGIGIGLNSTEASVSLVDVPSAPQSLSATASSGKVSLSWQAPASDGGSAIQHYKIYRSTTSGSGFVNIANTTDGTTTTYDDTNVVNGQTYYYKVSAVNAIGEGPSSAEASATPSGPPEAPQNLAGQPGDGWIYLTWQAPASDGGSTITQYLIYRSTTQGGPYTNIVNVSASVTNYNDTSVTNGQTYYYVVKAENALGVGPSSNEAKVTPGAVPSSPLNVTTQHGISWIYISWNAPADNGGSAIRYYLVYRSTTSGSGYTQVANVTDTFYNDTGLTKGQAYYYVVTAVNNDGEGPYSQEASDTPGTKPQAPAGVSVSEVGDKYVKLTWSAPSDDGGYPITAYRVYRAATSGGTFSYIGNTSTTTYIDNNNLTNGVTYYYKVTAVNQEGESDYSSEVSGTPMTVPTAPLNLTAHAGDGFVALNWTVPSDDGGSSITTYMIYRRATSQSSTFSHLANTTETSYNDTSVSNDQEYQYYVVAVNIMGASQPSNNVTVTPTSSGGSGGGSGGGGTTTTTSPSGGGTTTTTSPSGGGTTTTTPSGGDTTPSDSTTPSAEGDTNNTSDEAPAAEGASPDLVAPEFLVTGVLAFIFLSALLAPFGVMILRRMQG